jgi:hypothetical protein
VKGPSFLEGVLVALLAALGASIAWSVLELALPRNAALTLVVAGIGLGYSLYLLARSRERAGRIVMVIGWAVATGLAWSVAPDPWTQILVQAALVWLIRSLYHRSSALGSLLDLALILLGLASALWAGAHSGSLLLAVWCLFLVQATFGAIPERIRSQGSKDPQPDPFDLAGRAADSAIARLARRQPL